MTRRNMRSALLLTIAGLLLASEYTSGAASHWLTRGAAALLGSLIALDWSWRKR